MPDEHAPKVLLAFAPCVTAPLMPEQGPDLVSGVVNMDDTTFTTLLSLSSGASAISRFNCCALLDTEFPQAFIHQGPFDQMVETGAAHASYVRATTTKSWSGFGSQMILSTSRQARMTVQFHHNGVPSAPLAVWVYLVPDETIRCPIFLGRDNWMRFPSRSYQTLPSTPDGRVFDELTLTHICDNNPGGAPAIATLPASPTTSSM